MAKKRIRPQNVKAVWFNGKRIPPIAGGASSSRDQLPEGPIYGPPIPRGA